MRPFLDQMGVEKLLDVGPARHVLLNDDRLICAGNNLSGI